MVVDINVPVFSESVTEGTLLDWKKKPGERVERDELLVEIETDKVVLEVTALQGGVLTEIARPGGTTVQSGELLGRIDTEAQASAAPAAAPAAASAPAAPAANQAEAKTPVAAAAGADLSPAVRKIVAESGVSPADIAGTGKGGRVTKGDVIEHLEGGKPAAAAPARPAAPAAAAPGGPRPEQRVPMTRIRARIAERLKDVQNTAAILTTFNEVNMQPVMDLRKKYQDEFVKKHGTKLGFMSLFVKASTEALKKFPVINASVDGKDIIYHGYFDVGIAVSTERGLVVPILRDADQMSLAGIEKQIAEFGARGKAGKLTLEDLSGGTFSITNGGIFGSMMSTPILNAPQSAILGMHNIVDRAVVENGQIVIRPMMYLALSYDHRIIDGAEAVQFLLTVKKALEDPARLLLEL